MRTKCFALKVRRVMFCKNQTHSSYNMHIRNLPGSFWYVKFVKTGDKILQGHVNAHVFNKEISNKVCLLGKIKYLLNDCDRRF